MALHRKRILASFLAAVVAGGVLFGGNPQRSQAKPTVRQPVVAPRPGKPAAKTEHYAWQTESKAHGSQPAGTLSRPKIYRRLLQSTGWLVMKNSSGRVRGGATVWIIDSKHRLAVTCWHCVNKGPFVVYFPQKKDGTIITDPDHYLSKEKPVRASIIDTDKVNDLALIQLDSIPTGITHLPLAKTSPQPGEAMYTVGGKPKGSDGLWQFAPGMVRLVTVQKNGVGRRSRMVQGTGGNKGNSGGAWINSRGEVIAVHEGGFSGSYVSNLTLSVDVTVVRKFVDNAVTLLNPQTAAEFVRRGRKHYEAGRLNEALRDYNAAIQRDSAFADAYRFRGQYRYLAGDFLGAVDDLNAAIKHGSREMDVFWFRGWAFWKLGRTDRAIEDLTKAVDLAPDNWVVYRDRGNFHLKAGNYAAAVDDLTQALKKSRTAGRSGSTSSFAAATGRWSTAMSRYQTLAKMFLARGRARYHLGELNEALTDLRIAEKHLHSRSSEARSARLLISLCKQRLQAKAAGGK